MSDISDFIYFFLKSSQESEKVLATVIFILMKRHSLGSQLSQSLINFKAWIPNVSVWVQSPTSTTTVTLQKPEQRRKENPKKVAGCHPVIKPLNSSELTRNLGRYEQIMPRIEGRKLLRETERNELHFSSTKKQNNQWELYVFKQ